MADQGLPESLLTMYTVGPDLEAGARSSFIWGPQKGERGDGRGVQQPITDQGHW